MKNNEYPKYNDNKFPQFLSYMLKANDSALNVEFCQRGLQNNSTGNVVILDRDTNTIKIPDDLTIFELVDLIKIIVLEIV